MIAPSSFPNCPALSFRPLGDAQCGRHHIIILVRFLGHMSDSTFLNSNCSHAQKTWSGLSPTRNPVNLRLWGLSFSVKGDVPNLDSDQIQGPSSIGLWSDPKSEFSGTKSPDPDPRESQICLLGASTASEPLTSLGGRARNCDVIESFMNVCCNHFKRILLYSQASM